MVSCWQTWQKLIHREIALLLLSCQIFHLMLESPTQLKKTIEAQKCCFKKHLHPKVVSNSMLLCGCWCASFNTRAFSQKILCLSCHAFVNHTVITISMKYDRIKLLKVYLINYDVILVCYSKFNYLNFVPCAIMVNIYMK